MYVYKLINPNYITMEHEGFQKIDITDTVDSLEGWVHLIPVTPNMKVARLSKWFKDLPEPVKVKFILSVGVMKECILLESPLGVKTQIEEISKIGASKEAVQLLEEVCFKDYQPAKYYEGLL